MTLRHKSRIDPFLPQIREWTEQGWTTKQIGEQLGCSSVLVQQVMRLHDIPRNAPHRNKGRTIERKSILDPHIEKIRQWTAEGQRIGQIAKTLGCSKQCVWDAMEKHGIPRHPKHSCPGSVNPAWKGGRYFDDDGYVMIYAPDHPHADKAGRVREHRLVMEKVLGRYLLLTEVVDHIDGNRSNNDPSNLRVFASNREHLAETLRGRVPQWSDEGLARIQQANRQKSRSQQTAIPGLLETDGEQ